MGLVHYFLHGLLEIRDQIISVFNPYAEADKAV
jgi:hypothetical protein